MYKHAWMCKWLDFVFSLSSRLMSYILILVKLSMLCLQADLFWCYKIVFDIADLNFGEFFEWSPHRGARSNKYKLYKKFPGTRNRLEFFSERVTTVWNELSPLILAQLLVLNVVF